MKRPINPAVQQEGGAILVMTSESTPMETAASEESLDNLVSQNQMETNVQGEQSSSTPSGATEALGGMNAKSGLSLGQGQFVGEKISLEFGQTDVRTIINTIADKSGVNLIMDKDVEGTTSLRLRNVPWDQALLVLLRSQGLGYVKRGNVLRIAKQSTLSQEAQSVSNQIQNEKKAKLLSGGIKVKYIPVSYANVSELSGKLAEFTSEDGKIAFDNRTSSLVITDYGEYIERILELVKALDTPPMQVEIESKLIEAREEFSREAGINWDIAGQDFPINSQTGSVSAGLSNNLPTDPTRNFSLDLNVGTFDIFGDLNAALNIFESQNKIKVLSQPRVVTMNKVEAVIEQTTQVPIRQLTINPGSPPTVTFTFVDLVLSLKVTPQITFKGDVILDVEMRREFAGVVNTDGARELSKRRAKSTVMVKNGKTAVIGGIYQVDDTDTDAGIPWLKDIPLVGYLFKQVAVTKSKNELLLFLKPKIIKEVDGPMVSKTGAPGSNFDPFEELSLDEGSASTSNSVETATSSETNGLEGFDDGFEDDFGDDDFGNNPEAGAGEGQFDETPLDDDFDSLTL
jgi:type IV pilus assembly protein PilQ